MAVKNPHDLTRVTGSSSGGSAAAVASGMVPVALGTQTGGSIIRPGSWCGVYAMKPSFGLIPRTGVLKTTDTLDTMGFFGRSVQDLGLLLESLRVKGHNFPIQENNLKKYQNLPKKWRISFVGDLLLRDTENYVNKELNKLKMKLGMLDNVQIVEKQLPCLVQNFAELHRRIYHPCLLYYLSTELEKSKSAISPILMEIFEDAKTIPPEDYSKALQEQACLARDIEAYFLDNQVDIVLSYSSNGSAPIVEPKKHYDLNQLWTMCWLPVVQVPQFKCSNGLPFGFQVVGPRYSDVKILSFLNMIKESEIISKESEISV